MFNTNSERHVQNNLETEMYLMLNREVTAVYKSCFGGLEVACWPLVPTFAGSHPAEAVGFLGQKKSSARLPSEGK
jgi:hypothetical protein